MKKERESGMELLRIIAMLLVITAHAFSYGGFYDKAVSAGGGVSLLALLTKLLTRSGVNIFVLITGFFMINFPYNFKKSLSRSKDVYIKIIFYSVTLSAFFLVLGPEYCYYGNSIMPTAKIILRAVFPLSSQQWYFLTDYLLLCLVAPFINRAVQGIEKKHFTFLITVLILVFSIWQTLFYIKPFSDWLIIYGYKDIPEGKNLFFFIFLYLVGGYIKTVKKESEKPRLRYLLLAFASLILNFVLFEFLPKSVGYKDTGMNYSNIFVIAVAAFLVMFFSDMHFKNKFINTLASTTLGIYAIHEFCFVRNIVWKVFNFEKYNFSNLSVNCLRLAGAVIAVFAFGAIVDLLRQQLFKFTSFAFKKIKNKK